MRLHRKHQTATDDLAVHPNSACAAHAMFAAHMGPRKLQMLPEKVSQVQPRQDLRFDALTLHHTANGEEDTEHGIVFAEAFPPLNYEKGGQTIDLAFWRAPERLLDESDELVEWARIALAAAARVAAKRDRPAPRRQKAHPTRPVGRSC